MKKVFLVDAYDSFVFIISQYFQAMGLETEVVRHDVSAIDQRIVAFKPDIVVLGPGPGHPREVGYVELIHQFAGSIPILGVCLGHQAIGLAYGAEVVCADFPMHGKVSIIHNDGKGVYLHTDGKDFTATRYHSLIIKEETIPSSLVVTSHSQTDGYVMGVRHQEYPIEGVQFHPESILTQNGQSIFQSFIDHYVQA
jgi:anthranilate synthase component 2